jgi:hypothetical protein
MNRQPLFDTLSITYLRERRAMFLHIPRTGGTWVKGVVRGMGVPMERWRKPCHAYRGRKHVLLSHLLPELFAKVDCVFCFVRRPSSFYVSNWRATARSVCRYLGYEKYGWKKNNPAINEVKWEEVLEGGSELVDRWLKHTKYQHRSEISYEGVRRWKSDFDEWMEVMLEEEPGWATRVYERFVGPQFGEFPHYIGRTETIDRDVEEVMNILGYGKEWES